MGKVYIFGEKYKLHSTVSRGYGLKVMLFAVFLLESFALFFGRFDHLEKYSGSLGFFWLAISLIASWHHPITWSSGSP
ncbi:MAG: hypothetical protein ACLRWM_04790 [Streptococcus sp.]